MVTRAPAPPDVSHLQLAVPVSKPKSVKVQVSELETLWSCLDRSLESQKRLCDSMTFFTRQFEDEKKILVEARQAVRELIIKGNLIAERG